MGTVRNGVYYSKHKGDEIDNLLDKTVWQSNPNLLDNWYFVGGGSQQGGGQFPINQRGQTSYSGAGYGIDRWYANGGTVAINSDGIMLSDFYYGGQLYQKLENPTQYAGKTMTLSVLGYAPSGYYCAININDLFPLENLLLEESLSCVSLTFICPENTSSVLGIVFANFVPGATGKIIAVKLELGDTQTLAHQENGVWVLNELPNYQEQLARCQRYQLVISGADYDYNVGIIMRHTTASATLMIPTPVTMRANPTIITSATLRNVSYLSIVQLPTLNGKVCKATQNMASVIITEGDVGGDGRVDFEGSGSIILDANL